MTTTATTLTDARARISAATTLDELLETLQAIETELDEQDLANLDRTSLPVFGGTEPRDTTGIWSWDAERLLVTDCNGDYKIEKRSEQ